MHQSRVWGLAVAAWVRTDSHGAKLVERRQRTRRRDLEHGAASGSATELGVHDPAAGGAAVEIPVGTLR